MKKTFETVLDTRGRPVTNASVTVTVTGTTTKATLYSDNGTTVTDNPVFTDALGLYEFYVADGRYDITTAKGGIATRVIQDVLIEDATDNAGGGIPLFNGRDGPITLTSKDVEDALGFMPPSTSSVPSFNGRDGPITLTGNDIEAALGFSPIPVGGVVYAAARGFITATADQTVLTVPEYTMGNNNLDVFLNGLKQDRNAFTETDSATITMSEALAAGDLVEVVVYSNAASEPTTPPTVTRDPLLQPFATHSVWNTPIGSSATYASAATSTGRTLGNPNSGGGSGGIWATMPINERNHIIQSPSSPSRTVAYSSAAWTGINRCSPTGESRDGLPFSAPMPDSFVVPNNNENGSTAILLSDGRTYRQCQPFTRCSAGGNATAVAALSAWTVDLYGRGETGAQGGSGLSAIGGTIRTHELRPGQTGPKHALKVMVYARQFLYAGSPKFKWPAITQDGYASGWYGTNANGTAVDDSGESTATSGGITNGGATGTNTNSNMVMGALLALHPSATVDSLGIQTEPGKQLFWTLQNYGAYIVDDTHSAGFGIATENGPNGSVAANMLADYGITIDQRIDDISNDPVLANRQWAADIRILANNLMVVTNNTQSLNLANEPAGGGTPRVAFAADIAP